MDVLSRVPSRDLLLIRIAGYIVCFAGCLLVVSNSNRLELFFVDCSASKSQFAQLLDLAYIYIYIDIDLHEYPVRRERARIKKQESKTSMFAF